MSEVSNPILKQYMKLTEFLGLVLGPDYEVVLHDLTDKNHSVIAIANGHVSGRKVGAPLTNMALGILRDKSYETKEYRIHDYGVSVNGKDLRSNTMFIKENGRLIGMLCVNFDDSRYRELSHGLMKLCHPDAFVGEVVFPEENAPAVPLAQQSPEKFRNSTDAVVVDAVAHELEAMGVEAERLTSEERLRIIEALEGKGIFLLKGAVKDVSSGLCCSQASVYRYLSKLKTGKDPEAGEVSP